MTAVTYASTAWMDQASCAGIPDFTEAEQLRERLTWANNSAQSWRDQAEAAERQRRAQKGVTTKLKKRIAAGVCPCCKRSFVDLQRHISGQHPAFGTGADA